MKHSSTKHEYHFFSNPVKVIEHNWSDNTIPMVSVHCVTYNHERYIRDALEGFLMQRTTFPFQICILDDASTDDNVKIIKEYANKYPNLFKCFFLEENTWGKPNRLEMAKPFLDACNEGKYIAFCEGDDYWTDPLKLQKQVDYLKQNEEYGLVHGDCHFYYQVEDKFKHNANNNHLNRQEVTSKRELFYSIVNGEYKIRTATVLFRKALLDQIHPNEIQFLMGDTPQWLDFSQITKFKYFDEVFSVYRISPGSISRSKNRINNWMFKISMAEMRIYYCQKYNYPINEKLRSRYNEAIFNYKLLANDYTECFPLLEPTAYQTFKNKKVNNKYFRLLFRLEIFSTLLLKRIISKVYPRHIFN